MADQKLTRQEAQARKSLQLLEISRRFTRGKNAHEISQDMDLKLADVTKALETLNQQYQVISHENYQRRINLICRRYDVALDSVWEDVEAGDLKAIRVMLAIERDRARLLGLNDADRQRYGKLTREQLIERIGRAVAGSDQAGVLQAGARSGILEGRTTPALVIDNEPRSG